MSNDSKNTAMTPTFMARRAYRLEEDLFRLFTADSPRAYGIAFAVAVGIALLFSAMLFVTGASHQRVCFGDHAVTLDAGSRIISGQRPYVDFGCHEGVVSYLPVVLGMMIGGVDVASLGYGPAALLPILAIGTWWIAKRRFSALMAMLLSVLVGGLTIGTFAIGFSDWNIPTYAMQYNRFGWSFSSSKFGLRGTNDARCCAIVK